MNDGNSSENSFQTDMKKGSVGGSSYLSSGGSGTIIHRIDSSSHSQVSKKTDIKRIDDAASEYDNNFEENYMKDLATPVIN